MASAPQSFFNAIGTQILGSDALAAKLGAELAANHVIYRRFRRGAEDANHAARVLLAPMLYLWPGNSTWRPMTENNASAESTVNCAIVQRAADTGTALESVLTFADTLVKELMKEADGTGGGSSFLSNIGHRLRARIETPAEDGNASQSEVRLNIVFSCTLNPVV